MNAGQEFVKKIGPLGSVLFLLMFVAFLILCFMPPKTSADEYTAPHDSEYYSQSDETLGELMTELSDNFFPLMGVEAELELSEGKIVVSVPYTEDAEVRTALKKFYDMELFEIRGVIE